MELNELNEAERIALVALLDLVVESDSDVSEAEMEKLQNVVDAIGPEHYEAAADEVDSRFLDEDALRAFLPSITRQAARELIYTTVLDAALSDSVNHHESDLLTWLEKTWGIAVQTDQSGTPT